MIDAQTLKTIQNQPKETVRERISRGYYWLKRNLDHPQFKKHLELYEALVRRARELGLKEEDCWTVEYLPEEEIEAIFDPKPHVKSLFE